MKGALIWTAAVAGLLAIVGCATGHSTSLTYSNPPRVGSAIRTGTAIIVCDSRAGARYMTLTGFFHADCSKQVTLSDVRIDDREHEDLGQGGMWLLRVPGPEARWFVLPWHDWV